MKPASRLPRIISFLFALSSWLAGLVAVAVLAVIVINPHFTGHGVIGGSVIELSPPAGNLAIKADGGDTVFVITSMRGNLGMANGTGQELFRLVKRTILPLILVYAVFFTALFDLLRRLFRNVGRGDSFTRGNIRLVYAVGIALIVFSLASAAAEGWLSMVIIDYFRQHAVIAKGGLLVVTGDANALTISHESGLYGSPVFFSGLLVLALAEVFRQGLALKEDGALTI
jgi:hypothetical protein